MKSWSLRNRLTVLYGGLFLLAGVALLAILYLVVQHRLDDQLNHQTDTRVAALRRQQAGASGTSTITMPDGSTVSVEQFARQAHAEQEAIKNAALNSLLTQGGIAVLAVGIVAAGAGRLVAGRALYPLHAITATAERIAGSRTAERDLHERIALTGRDDDTKRLADSFDSMLDTLEQTFDSQRRFVASASHELRTPLALERALIELETTKPTATPETIHFGTSLLHINERHTKLIEGLLLLADSENEIEEPTPVDLKDVVAHVLTAAQIVDDDRAVSVRADLHHAPVMGDPVLLEQLVRNLVENAQRHNVDDGWISVTTRTESTSAILEIANTGPAIPPYETDALFQPFRRHEDAGPATAKRGFGLGLSIVKAIVTTHSGTVTARARDEGGLDITVEIPAQHPSDPPDRQDQTTAAQKQRATTPGQGHERPSTPASPRRGSGL